MIIKDVTTISKIIFDFHWLSLDNLVLTLCLETVRQQFVHVLELIFLPYPIEALVQSPEVLMVGEQRTVGLDPRAEDMHVVVIRIAVKVDEIGIVFGTELLHELTGYVYKLLLAFLPSLDGQGIVEL